MLHNTSSEDYSDIHPSQNQGKWPQDDNTKIFFMTNIMPTLRLSCKQKGNYQQSNSQLLQKLGSKLNHMPKIWWSKVMEGFIIYSLIKKGLLIFKFWDELLVAPTSGAVCHVFHQFLNLQLHYKFSYSNGIIIKLKWKPYNMDNIYLNITLIN